MVSLHAIVGEEVGPSNAGVGALVTFCVVGAEVPPAIGDAVGE